MMPDAKSFSARIDEIATDFLQTCVVVDDRGLDRVGTIEPTRVTPSPGADEPAADVQGEFPEAVRLDLADPVESTDKAHRLDAKGLIDAFAEKGLVCGVIDPDLSDDEDLVITRSFEAARSSDLLVLDWFILEQHGDISLEILDRVLEEAAGETRRRLRLIAIYTGEPGLDPIVERVAARLDKHYRDCDLNRTMPYTVTKGPVRVVVLAKPDARVADVDRRVEFADLPARLIGEFARFAQGIVRAVGLASLAALRRDTHRLLQVLHPDLDPGYLADRARLPRPADAEHQLLEIVVGEVRSILEDNEVTAIAELPALEAWAVEAVANGVVGKAVHNQGLTADQIILLLRDGLATEANVGAAKDAGVGLKGHPAGQKQASRAFCDSPQQALEADARYANRVLGRSQYGSPRRQLDLGTIVLGPGSEYLLCVQPQCDATGLTAATAFPFLPLAQAQAGESADFVVTPMGGAEVRLRLKARPSDLRLITFKPDAGDHRIFAAVEEARHVFDAGDGCKLEWVSQLRPSFAQRAAHQLGSQFSRVAVDDPESLRLSRR